MIRKGYCSFLLILLGLSFSIGCNKGNAPQVQAVNHTAPKATLIDPATVATITGTVDFAGTPPKPKTIDMSNDPGCKGHTASEQVVVDDGHLANVLVYVKSGLAPRSVRSASAELSASSRKVAATFRTWPQSWSGSPCSFEDA